MIEYRLLFDPRYEDHLFGPKGNGGLEVLPRELLADETIWEIEVGWYVLARLPRRVGEWPFCAWVVYDPLKYSEPFELGDASLADFEPSVRTRILDVSPKPAP